MSRGSTAVQADPIATAIENARILIETKSVIRSDLQSARDFLNQAVRIGVTTNEQTEWILANLPKRTRVKGEDGEVDPVDGE